MKAECEHGLDTRLPCGDCQKAYEEENAPSSVQSTSLLGFFVPAHLEEDFDCLMDMALSAADTMDRESWSVQERELYDWISERKYKPNAEAQLRRGSDVS